MFTTRKRVLARSFNEEPYKMQYLVEETLLFGKVIWRRTLDTEEVPVYAWAQHACLGSTEWKSKFRDVIMEQQ